MPAAERSVLITDEYRRRLRRIYDAAGVLAAQNFGRVDAADLNGSWPAMTVRTLAALTELQRAGVTLTAAYVAAFVASETGGTPHVPLVDTARVGLAAHGAPMTDAIVGPLVGIKSAIKDGQAVSEALQAGRDRTVRLVQDAALGAPRAALQDVLATDRRLVGWRRVSGGGCGACLALADNITRPTHEPMHVHPHCLCTAEPVVRDVTERVERPSGETVFRGLAPAAQDALLGDEKAKLVRDGRVPFRDLVAVDPMRVGPDLITEAPLSALLAH